MFRIGILPASIVHPSPLAAAAWVVARSIDHIDNGGTGAGVIRIDIKDFCYYLRRTQRSVWRYVRQAVKDGYFYSCEYKNGFFRIAYRGLKSLSKHLGLTSIGSIAELPLVKVQHLKTWATDQTAELIQAQSDFKRREERGKEAKHQSRAFELLGENSASVRVPGAEIITTGKRLLYLSKNWVPFGASQEAIAQKLGVSLRTVQYRVSNTWREDRGIAHIQKKQTAQLIMDNCSKSFMAEVQRFEDEPNRFVRVGRKLFKVGCNLYTSPLTLRNQRFRAVEFWAEQSLDSPSTLTLHNGVLSRVTGSDKELQKAKRKHTTKSKIRKSVLHGVASINSLEIAKVTEVLKTLINPP
jgi:hypothetical protein